MRTDHRVLIVTNLLPSNERPYEGTFIGTHISGLLSLEIPTEVLYVNRREQGRGAYWRVQRQLNEKIRSFSPTLVHTTYGGVLANEVTKVVKELPVVVSFCGSDLLGVETGTLLKRFSAQAGVWASRRAARRATAIIVKSKNLLQALPNDVEREKIHIVTSGVDIDLFHPLDPTNCRAELGWSSDAYHLLFCGNDLGIKGYDLALETIEKCKEKGLNVQLHILKEIPHSKVPLWINAAHALLLTSRHEGSPNIVKEALACNCPVVSVDVGDVREQLNGVSHSYICERSADALSEKILAITSVKEARSNGRQRAQSFGCGLITEKILEIYNSVYSCRPGIPNDRMEAR